MSYVPKDLLYSSNHTWVETQSDGSMRVGITDFAQEQLGDVVFIELPEVGRAYAQDEECGVIESVKSASDLYSPVTGEVIAVNEGIEDSPEKINEDAYGDGWLFQIKQEADADDDDLMSNEEYEQHTDEE